MIWDGGAEIVPSVSETLRYRDLFEEHYRALAWAIRAAMDQGGEKSPSGAEMQFAALEVYQSACATDGFASLFYNEPEMIPHMLEGTRVTGANRAHSLLVRGLEALGLESNAAASAIAEQSKRLLNEDDGDARLSEAFDSLEEEFDEKVRHLEEPMLTLLVLHREAFTAFP